MTETTKSSKTAMQPSTKAVGWKTVSVFVSSTFDDMHAERDYLVKEVFPRLREWPLLWQAGSVRYRGLAGQVGQVSAKSSC